MKIPRKKRTPTAAEMKDGRYECEFNGREMDQVVETKTGADGIEETHISYEPNKHSGYRKTGAGKGDKPRPFNRQRFYENYDKIDWSK